MRLSKIFKGVPMAQQEAAVYWTEHVLAHGGAVHLKPPSAHMLWYQLMLLDVMAAILVAMFVLSVAIYLVCKAVLRLLTINSKKTSKSKKRN